MQERNIQEIIIHVILVDMCYFVTVFLPIAEMGEPAHEIFNVKRLSKSIAVNYLEI